MSVVLKTVTVLSSNQSYNTFQSV